MQRYIIRRVLLFFPTLLLASLVIFAVMRFLPGDVAVIIMGGEEANPALHEQTLRQLRQQLGLLDPLPVQYGKWLWSMVSGDFGGRSLRDNQPVGEIIARRLPVTLQLVFYTLVVATVIGVPLGIIAALYQNRWPDYSARILSIAGLALPSFWVAMLIILGLVVFFSWTPPLIYMNAWEDPAAHFQIVVWPTLVLAWGLSAYIARVTRASMLEVLRQDYVRTAYSKGLAPRTVLWRHAFRNTLIPVVTLTGTYIGVLFSGTIILEAIFGIPGMGQGMLTAASSRDYPVVQSLVMLSVFIVLALNLVIDILYVFIDPRISYE